MSPLLSLLVELRAKEYSNSDLSLSDSFHGKLLHGLFCLDYLITIRLIARLLGTFDSTTYWRNGIIVTPHQNLQDGNPNCRAILEYIPATYRLRMSVRNDKNGKLVRYVSFFTTCWCSYLFLLSGHWQTASRISSRIGSQAGCEGYSLRVHTVLPKSLMIPISSTWMNVREPLVCYLLKVEGKKL
jgi:hypothetical protein